MTSTKELLNPEKALIFRIAHLQGAPDMLAHGLHCKNSKRASSTSFVPIGNPELIEKRHTRVVFHAPGGTLSDYVPFYFTPFSPMLYNICTGHNGITKRPNEDIVIFVTSLHRLVKAGVPFLFSDRHAYLKFARFTNDLQNLDWIDWESLQRRNFKKDETERFDRYQAEALVHRHLPVSALMGMVCYNDAAKTAMQAEAARLGMSDFKITKRRDWYF
jgi:hypothetical protein